uniref:Uncharacterized protein n=1 Tax=Rhizophagus irregularis (strain DAOM 181602 / DAOM 197198 / MUCL 43194) TaxID=747089 RepID=U9SZD5_RHIID
MLFENNGIFEWDVIIEKDCNASWVGVPMVVIAIQEIEYYTIIIANHSEMEQKLQYI